MTEDEILDYFHKLEIFEDSFPDYNDPYSFASKFKKCSLWEDTDITTSEDSILLE